MSEYIRIYFSCDAFIFLNNSCSNIMLLIEVRQVCGYFIFTYLRTLRPNSYCEGMFATPVSLYVSFVAYFVNLRPWDIYKKQLTSVIVMNSRTQLSRISFPCFQLDISAWVCARHYNWIRTLGILGCGTNNLKKIQMFHKKSYTVQ